MKRNLTQVYSRRAAQRDVDPDLEECFHACASGCGFKFGISPEKAEQVRPNRPLPLPPPPPSPLPDKSISTVDVEPTSDDLPATSA